MVPSEDRKVLHGEEREVFKLEKDHTTHYYGLLTTHEDFDFD